MAEHSAGRVSLHPFYFVSKEKEYNFFVAVDGLASIEIDGKQILSGDWREWRKKGSGHFLRSKRLS